MGKLEKKKNVFENVNILRMLNLTSRATVYFFIHVIRKTLRLFLYVSPLAKFNNRRMIIVVVSKRDMNVACPSNLIN